MTEPEAEATRGIVSPVLGRLTLSSAIGYLLFAAGIVVGAWFAWTPQPDGSNPFLVLLLVWVIVGVTQVLIRAYWRACAISAVAAAVGYSLLVVTVVPDQASNEMFGAGIIEVGLFGFVLSMVMGIPVAVYRRVRSGVTREGR